MKIYHKIIRLILISVIFISVQSCEKNELIPEKTINERSITDENKIHISDNYLYYIDNKVVSKDKIDLYKKEREDMLMIHTLKKDKDTYTNVIFAYTTEEGYIEYGKKNNMMLEEELIFVKHMREYAKESGAVAEYEKTGQVPEWYSKYQEEYYLKTFNKSNNTKVAFVLYDTNNYSGQQLGVPYFCGYPTLSHMKNKTSSVRNFGTGASMTFFDKSFFRNRMISIPFLPVFGVVLPSSYDNKTESVVTH
jgi:hypothetical protein